jgi:hypothetical protein
MKRFLRMHADQIKGVLCGFDRMRFRGTLRWLAYTQGMKNWKCHPIGNGRRAGVFDATG